MNSSKKIKHAKSLIIKAARKYDSEFSYLKSTDANGSLYYYFHFKPRGEQSSVSEAIGILQKLKIRFARPLESEWKTLIFVPFNQKLKYIIHSKKEIYEIT